MRCTINLLSVKTSPYFYCTEAKPKAESLETYYTDARLLEIH